MPQRVLVSIDQLRRVCRMYSNAKDAARALGINPRSMYRIIKREGIEPRWKKSSRGG